MKIIELLSQPNTIIKVFNNINKYIIFISYLVYLLLGIYLNSHQSFPCFFQITILLNTILIIIIKTISILVGKIERLNEDFFWFHVSIPVSNKMLTLVRVSKIYLIAPVFTSIFFTVYGCILFTKIKYTFTLLWILSLFMTTVYLSIIGYVQFILFAYYLHTVANIRIDNTKICNTCYAITDLVTCIAKIVHMHRLTFFVIGMLYMFIFRTFFISDGFGVDTTTYQFKILLTIIVIALVPVFPTVSIIEYKDILKLMVALKSWFRKSLRVDDIIISMVGDNKQLTQTDIGVIMINNLVDRLPNYPVKSFLNVVCSTAISIITTAAAVATIYQTVISYYL